MNQVVTLGESMVLFAPTRQGLLRYASQFERFVAGAESNTAIGLARLGHAVGWISRVGDDEFGQYMLSFLRGEKVDVSQVTLDEHAPTGVFFKERRRKDSTRVFYYRAGSAASHMSEKDLNPAYIREAKYLHLSGITPALSKTCQAAFHKAIDIAKEAGTKISFDPNLRLKLWTAEEARKVFLDIIPNVDMVLTNAEEADLITESNQIQTAAKRLLDMGPSQVIIKQSADGSFGMTNNEAVALPGLSVEVVETVGAGDAFNAGFLSGQLRGWGLTASLRLGNIMGALATTVSGDVEGLPDWKEVQSYLGKRKSIER